MIRNNKSAFTLVEIMIVVAIIGLLASMAIPGMVKARKQSQGRRIISDVRILDAALEQGVLERGYKDGDPVWIDNNCNSANCRCMWSYMKGTSIGPDLYGTPKDVLGNQFVFGVVGTNMVRISTATKSALAGVGIDWGVY
jgi:prepilin-type N-terminal cleavage/methylation domain-containing protein